MAALCLPRTSCNWVKCWMKATTSVWKRCVCTYCTEAICKDTFISHSRSRNGSGSPYLHKESRLAVSNRISYSEGRKVEVNYLSMLKMSASPPCVVKRSLYRSPCGVRSLSDRLPRLPCKARSPSKTMQRKDLC